MFTISKMTLNAIYNSASCIILFVSIFMLRDGTDKLVPDVPMQANTVSNTSIAWEPIIASTFASIYILSLPALYAAYCSISTILIFPPTCALGKLGSKTPNSKKNYRVCKGRACRSLESYLCGSENACCTGFPDLNTEFFILFKNRAVTGPIEYLISQAVLLHNESI